MFNAAATYLSMRERYLKCLLDDATGTTPCVGEEKTLWRPLRAYLKGIWESTDEKAALFAPPVAEPLFPYPSCGKTINQLIEEKVLHPWMSHYVDQAAVGERPQYTLYTHQLKAIQESKEHHIVVASGTGSGKTECFLYPMINNLLQSEDEQEIQQDGVRILLIYPTNALVNDQCDRIKALLNGGNNPAKLSVGKYTGQTRTQEEERVRRQAAAENYRCDRQQLRANPPHILITNYSMMEYMMLRRSDKPLFAAKKLQAIILDEAHLYSGTLGNDINLLIRRILPRFGVSREQVRFYATSATIGDNSPQLLTEAAAALFGEPPEKVHAILGTRKPYPEAGIQWPGATPEQCTKALELRRRMVQATFTQLSNEDLDLLDAMPPEVRDEKGRPFLPYKLHTFIDSPNRVYSDLAFSEDKPLGNLQRYRQFDGNRCGLPTFVNNSAKCDYFFFGYLSTPRQQGLTFFRYLFGDTENLQGTYFPIYLRLRHAEGDDGLERYTVTPTPGNDQMPAGWRFQQDPNGNLVIAVEGGAINLVTQGNPEWRLSNGYRLVEFAEAEGDNVGNEDEAGDGEPRQNNAQNTTYANRNSLKPLGFYPVKLRTILCTEAIFPHLPDVQGVDNPDSLPWRGRQMLFFSDSRAGAAETAVALQNTHQVRFFQTYLYRTLLTVCGGELLTFGELKETLCNDDDFLEQLVLPQALYDTPGVTDEDRKGWKKNLMVPGLLIRTAAVRHTGWDSLESVGVLQVEPTPWPEGTYAGPAWEALRERLKGNDKQTYWAETVYPALVHLLRRSSKLYFPQFQDYLGDGLLNDEQRVRLEVLQNALGFTFSTLRGTDAYLTARNFATYYKDFFRAYFNLPGPNEERAAINQLASAVLQFVAQREDLFHRRDRRSWDIALMADSLRFKALDKDNVRVWAERRTNRPTLQEDEQTAYDVTEIVREEAQKVAAIRDADIYLQDEFGGWHFTATDCGGLRIPEHSAQLENEKLGRLETEFRDHKINIFSCTPTLEVGVNIGSLSTVLLNNLPPEKANYIQRAGRAGRRSDGSALILTFLRNSLRDGEILRNAKEALFERPSPFAKADVSSRHTQVQVKRHINQFLLNAYFHSIAEEEQRQRGALDLPQTGDNPIAAWETAGNFLADIECMRLYRGMLDNILQVADLRPGTRQRFESDRNRLEEYLQQMAGRDGRPRCMGFGDRMLNLIEQDENVLNAYIELVDGTCCDRNDDALRTHIQDLDAALQRCSTEFNAKLRAIVRELERLQADGTYSARCAALRERFWHLYREQLISCLIHERVLPAYGFPIDVRTFTAGDNSLDRNSFQALADFVPGSNITVAHEKFSVDALMPNVYNQDGNRFQSFMLIHCPYCKSDFVRDAWTQTAEGPQGECPHCHRLLRTLNAQEAVEDAACIQALQMDAEEEGDEEDAPKVVVRRYISPEGYLSRQRAQEAATTQRGRIRITIEKRLLLPQQLFEDAAGNDSIETRVYSADTEDATRSIECLGINAGRYGRGYWIDKDTGELRVRSNDEAELRDWGRDRRLLSSVLAYRSKCSAWICAIPSQRFGNNRSLQKLFQVALKMAVLSEAQLDSRALNVCIQQRKGRTLFCFFDLNGESAIFLKLDEAREQVLADAFNRLIQSRDPAQRMRQLLSYATDRDLASFTERDYHEGATWAERMLTLTFEERPTREIAGTRYAFDYVDGPSPLLCNVKGRRVRLFVPNLTLEAVSDSSLLNKLCSECCVRALDVIFTMPANLSEQHRKILRAVLAGWRDAPGIQPNCYELSPEDPLFTDFCAQGKLAFMVGDTPYFWANAEETPDLLASYGQNDRVPDVIVPREGLRLPLPTQEQLVQRPAQLPPYGYYETRGDETLGNLPLSQLLERLNWDNVVDGQAPITRIHVRDPYFHKLAGWKTLEFLLRALRQRNAYQDRNLVVEIDTGFPTIKREYTDREGRRQVEEVDKVIQPLPCEFPNLRLTPGLEVCEADTHFFTEYLQRQLSLSSCSIHYNRGRQVHDRKIVFTQQDGTSFQLVLGKGLEFLRFPNDHHAGLGHFTRDRETAPACIRYEGGLNFFLVRT